jgi:prepilin-type N-terminal cleavage/methylation domain-containing protein
LKNQIVKQYQKTIKTGFTLIELLVVIALIFITTAAVLLTLTANRSTQATQAAQREVISALKEAQNYALSGSGAHPDCGNVFTFSVSNSEDYGISGCRTGQYSLRNGVTFENTGTEVSFCAPHGTIRVGGSCEDEPYNGSPVRIRVQANPQTYCDIDILSEGRIEDKGCSFESGGI